jgi:surface protein
MPTIITNDNIRDLVGKYINDKNSLPEDLREKRIGEWVVSRVTDMKKLFDGYRNFNEDINDWDVSNVENMFCMFYGCDIFNKPLYKWDVSNVTDKNGMVLMFHGCEDFNEDINDWDVSNVKNMKGMFYACGNFNRDLSNWNVSNVEDMRYMFGSCRSFNQDLSNWDIFNVTNMKGMFEYCESLTTKPNWFINKKTITKKMFDYTPLKGQELERAPYDIREANKNVRNTNRLLNVLGRNKTLKNVKLPEIPEDIIYKTKQFFDPDELTKTIKKEKKNKIEDIKKGNVEELYLPPKPPSRDEEPGGGGYTRGRGKKRTQKRNKKA